MFSFESKSLKNTQRTKGSKSSKSKTANNSKIIDSVSLEQEQLPIKVSLITKNDSKNKCVIRKFDPKNKIAIDSDNFMSQIKN